MTRTKKMNKKALYDIAHKNPTSEAIFLTLATRERKRFETDLRRLRLELANEGFKVVPTDFNQVFIDLTDAGVGIFTNEQGHPPRFKWHFNSVDTSYAALGETKAKVIQEEKLKNKKLTVAKPRPQPVKKPEQQQKVSPIRMANLYKKPEVIEAKAPSNNTTILKLIMPNGKTAEMSMTKEDAKDVVDHFLRAL